MRDENVRHRPAVILILSKMIHNTRTGKFPAPSGPAAMRQGEAEVNKIRLGIGYSRPENHRVGIIGPQHKQLASRRHVRSNRSTASAASDVRFSVRRSLFESKWVDDHGNYGP